MIVYTFDSATSYLAMMAHGYHTIERSNEVENLSRDDAAHLIKHSGREKEFSPRDRASFFEFIRESPHWINHYD